MSIALLLSSITPELKKEITKTCILKPSKSQYDDDPSPVTCFAVNNDEDSVYIPLGTWRHFLDDFPEREYRRTNVRCKKELYTIDSDPKGYRDQDVVFEAAVERLEQEHTVFIAAATGYGKTTLGNYFTAHFKMPTLILSHLDSVSEQWEEEFKKNSTAKVHRIRGNKTIDPTADVYICGVLKAKTLTREEVAHIGLIIFDEAHIATVTAFSKSLLKFQPKYVIGLSATPTRADGMQKLLTMYFGPKKEFIERREVKDFTVYKVETPYEPEVKYQMVKGKMTPNWTHITNTIAYNTERHKYIANLCIKNPDHRILVLSDRTEQSQAIYNLLVEAGESVQLIIGAKKVKKITEESLKSRIIVGASKKVGTGFDDPTLTMLILASDCKNVAQWEGRIRTSNNVIYDLVDNYKTFENHWSKFREPWFLLRGATIEIIYLGKRKRENSKSLVPSKRFLKPNK
jgi:superfamily II DNA or RNA helicase